MLFQSKINYPKKSSIITQITLWYSSFIFILVIGVLIGSFFISKSIAENKSKKNLEAKAVQMSQALAKGHRYEAFEDGIFYSVYDQNGKVIYSGFPKGFKKDLDHQHKHKKKLSLFSMENRTFQYVDIPISGKNQWLRAIRTVDRLDKQLTELLFSLGIVLPLMLIIITVGGYLILKRTFRPIQEITETAQFITQNEDYTKRIITKNNENELTELAAVINTMLASIESSFVREKQFNNDVSHELRTPVTVILSESEYGKNYAENLIEAKESFEVIHRQSLSMKKLVEQLLELTKAENPLSIQLEPLNFSIMMKQLVSDSSRLLDNTPIHLDSQIEDDLWIIGQQTLLKRLFDNLFSNAIKFTNNHISISLRQSDNQIVFSIKDNGLGISVDDQSKIWNRFYQVDSARTKDSQSGIGLGLSLVKQIATIHRAKIWVDSKPDDGSQFTLTFPKLKKD